MNGNASDTLESQMQKEFAFEQRSWTFERWGWALMTLVLIAALLGGFGRGWLSRAAASAPSGRLSIAYERIMRLHAPGRITVRVQDPSPNPVRIVVGSDYFDDVQLLRIVPEPAAVIAGQESLTFEFHIAPGASEFKADFHFEVERAGMTSAEISVPGPPGSSLGPQGPSSPGGADARDAVRFTQVILP